MNLEDMPKDDKNLADGGVFYFIVKAGRCFLYP